MSYWNHFGEHKYEAVMFKSLDIGDKFRVDKFKGKRRRKDIICVKTGDLSYIEYKSKKKTNLHQADNYEVRSFSSTTHKNSQQ